MAEMDIYMRRRLVALGGLVLFFILFVLLVKSCGGEDEPAPATTPDPLAGATGASGAALSPEDLILRADEICGPANDQVGSLDPADPGAIQDEFEITRDELAGLQTLEPAEASPEVERFLSDLSAVVSALKTKAKAADPAAQDAAQLAIDTAEVEARESGKRAGFSECGAFLDAGDGPASGGGGGGGGGAATDTPTPPVDSGTVTPPVDDGTVTPPADDGTVTPPPPDDGGPDTGGGITP